MFNILPNLPSAPRWAQRSDVEDGGRVVNHVRSWELEQLAAAREVVPLELEVVQSDAVTMTGDGVTVLRDAAPTVLLAGLTLTLEQAHALGLALVELVTAVTGSPDDACASCGTARGEHGVAAHAFVEVSR